jgi:transcriptional regulator with XRE-family HTH domain
MDRSFSRDPEVALLRMQAGQWPKTRRTHAGFAQRQLANVLGLEYYTFISQLEHGIGRIPPERCEDWANALDVPVREFVRQTFRFYDPITLFTGGRNNQKPTPPGMLPLRPKLEAM